jgi:predicted metalloprotease
VAGGGGFGIGGRGIGIGTIVIALVGGAIFGINPLTILSLLSGGPAPVQQQAPAHAPPAQDRTAQVRRHGAGRHRGRVEEAVRPGRRHLPRTQAGAVPGGIRTGCGSGQSAMGPFYCPADEKVYIDLNFYRTLRDQLGAPGEFAQAYVIAHEVGHHVQHLLGITDKVDQLRARGSQQQGNALSVRLELQADCFAGVWAHHSQQSKQWLDPGDIEAAMNAAQKIGDDALQRSAGRGRGARELHARQQRAAPALVQQRLAERQHQVLRHVPGGVALGPGPRHCRATVP